MTTDLEPGDVPALRGHLVSEYGLPAGRENPGGVEALLLKIGMAGGDACRGAAILFEGLARLHLFADGNKRTALLSMMLYLDVNGYDFVMPPGAAEFVAGVAGTEGCGPGDVERLTGMIEAWIRENSRAR